MTARTQTDGIGDLPGLEALFSELEPGLLLEDDRQWLDELREAVRSSPEAAHTRANLVSPRFRDLCARLGIEPDEGRRPLAASAVMETDMNSEPLNEPRRPGVRRMVSASRIASAAVLVAVVAAAALLPTGEWLRAFLSWSQGVGTWGIFAFAAVYVLATVLFVPGLLLTLAAGALFGLLWGTLAVSLGSTVGVALAFLLGRYVARERVESLIAGRPRFRAIDDAVGHQGFKIVLLTRLSPVFPFNLLNYAYGVTRVSFRDYLIASWIGMLPGTVMYVYFGTLAGGLARVLAGEAGPGSTTRGVVLLVGGAIAVGVTVFVTRVARRALAGTIEREQDR
jgi:uncharacterized membrane protein YdjX (TVP38/TMEM64 family)